MSALIQVETVWHLMQACQDAYGDTPSDSTALLDDQSSPRGFLRKTWDRFAGRGGGTIAIAGTKSIKDFLTDARCFPPADVDGFPVHPGFHEEFLKIWPQILDTYRDMDYRTVICVTGHSLGGVLAREVAYHLAKVLDLDVTLVTLGEPKFSTPDFYRAFGKLVPRSVRIQHHVDLVPRLPHLFYSHAPNLLRLDDDGTTPTFSGILGFFERYNEVLLSDIDGQALADHHVDKYVNAGYRWRMRKATKGIDSIEV